MARLLELQKLIMAYTGGDETECMRLATKMLRSKPPEFIDHIMAGLRVTVGNDRRIEAQVRRRSFRLIPGDDP